MECSFGGDAQETLRSGSMGGWPGQTAAGGGFTVPVTVTVTVTSLSSPSRRPPRDGSHVSRQARCTCFTSMSGRTMDQLTPFFYRTSARNCHTESDSHQICSACRQYVVLAG
jgi:hypothetical protein